MLDGGSDPSEIAGGASCAGKEETLRPATCCASATQASAGAGWLATKDGAGSEGSEDDSVCASKGMGERDLSLDCRAFVCLGASTPCAALRLHVAGWLMGRFKPSAVGVRCLEEIGILFM